MLNNVPRLPKNLLSVKKLCDDKNILVVFDSKKVQVLNRKTKCVAVGGDGSGVVLVSYGCYRWFKTTT